ncbi:MAG TPA: hypothetical protein P5347_08925 [Smithellaceae bacterium]|nr:hypothetical protein [Smithellaceae bacterium]
MNLIEYLEGKIVVATDAAISTPCLVKDIPLDRWQNMLRVNLTSVFHCTTSVLPHTSPAIRRLSTAAVP